MVLTATQMFCTLHFGFQFKIQFPRDWGSPLTGVIETCCIECSNVSNIFSNSGNMSKMKHDGASPAEMGPARLLL